MWLIATSASIASVSIHLLLFACKLYCNPLLNNVILLDVNLILEWFSTFVWNVWVFRVVCFEFSFCFYRFIFFFFRFLYFFFITGSSLWLISSSIIGHIWFHVLAFSKCILYCSVFMFYFLIKEFYFVFLCVHAVIPDIVW
jgi:hypothetical protein